MPKEAAPTLDRLSAINPDGSRRHIQPADVHGRFVKARRSVYLGLIAIYVVLPFIRIGGRPALQLDVAARRFYILGDVFNAQDFWRVVFLLLATGFGLFFVTAWYGRVWCGWACPQTVFLEGVFRRVERWIEGSREQRIRLAAAPWSGSKILRKAVKHALYLLIALVLANVALAFFVSLPTMLTMVRESPADHWVAFMWVAAFTAAMYFNFAWFREQLCIVLCPYGRLQSALMDRDSVIIGYDRQRGEPRGKLTRTEREGTSLPVVPKGDCVDCGRCVIACPTGIDIRNGTQLECIGCAQCIDACDDVMHRLQKPAGLIRYDSLAGLEGQRGKMLRPRLIAYGLLFAMALIALILVTALRQPFEANVLRAPGAPYVLDGDVLRNQFVLHLINKNPSRTVFHVEVTASAPITVAMPNGDVPVASLDQFRLPLFVSVPLGRFHGPFALSFAIHDQASGDTKTVTVRFLGPLASMH